MGGGQGLLEKNTTRKLFLFIKWWRFFSQATAGYLARRIVQGNNFAGGLAERSVNC